ncbi:hypothetical protein OH710_24555 [Pseudomonas capsici]|uniref:hypothetical protein n=1 Tax=Pseudomonas capsici TaxID=2810614 RepID=UPI0021F1ABCD|nr:hypothetical protein [Pseudomonas capsici]MCV4275818.1 hypothetical protein [Pseudomonas capsici]
MAVEPWRCIASVMDRHAGKIVTQETLKLFLSDPREEILTDREKVYRPLHAWPRVDTSEAYYIAFIVDDNVEICPASILLSTQQSLVDFLTDCQEIEGLVLQELIVVMPPHLYNGERWLSIPISELSASFDPSGNLLRIQYQTTAGEFAEYVNDPKHEETCRTIYIAKTDKDFPLGKWNY